MSLIPHASKILLHIIAEKLKTTLKISYPQIKAGGPETKLATSESWWKKQNKTKQNKTKQNREYQQTLYLSFIYYSNAFDCVQHKQLRKIMNEMGFPAHIIQVVWSHYQDQEATVTTENGTTYLF